MHPVDVTPWKFSTCSESANYLHEVRDELLLLFDIEADEAVGRINEHFHGQDLTSEVATDVLLHEEQDIVARHVYYGRDSFWWTQNEAARQPLPWPPGKRD